MRYLLDTHALIWILTEDEKLSTAAITALSDGRNTFAVSAVSIAEISIKRQLRRASAPAMTGADALQLAQSAGCITLSFTPDHAAQLDQLPLHHHDPFDRMLIAQARQDDLTLVSRDSAFDAYGVKLLRC
jgi:PIN domain nuclease of toxin-antitoxin system